MLYMTTKYIPASAYSILKSWTSRMYSVGEWTRVSRNGFGMAKKPLRHSVMSRHTSAVTAIQAKTTKKSAHEKNIPRRRIRIERRRITNTRLIGIRKHSTIFLKRKRFVS